MKKNDYQAYIEAYKAALAAGRAPLPEGYYRSIPHPSPPPVARPVCRRDYTNGPTLVSRKRR